MEEQKNKSTISSLQSKVDNLRNASEEKEETIRALNESLMAKMKEHCENMNMKFRYIFSSLKKMKKIL